MATEYRPDVLGTPGKHAEHVDPKKAIAKIEADIQKETELLRKARKDHVDGRLSAEEFKRIEAEFEKKVTEQRQVLQNLKKAAMGEKK
jgi:hypothetical protein